MENKQQVIGYWRDCIQQQQLHNLAVEKIQTHWYTISQQESITGQLTQPELIKKLQPFKTIAILPELAERDHEYFCPYILLAELGPSGNFIPKLHLSLPIVPKTVLEEAILQPIVLTTAEQVANYLAVNQPEWLDEPSLLTWSAQLTYAQDMLLQISPDWDAALQQAGYALQADARVFALAEVFPAPAPVTIDILDNSDRIEIIAAKRNSGKSTYIKKIIINAWIDAAIHKSAPPHYVWIEPYKEVRYANIFTCLNLNVAPQTDIINHEDLVNKYNNYHHGQKILQNWQNVSIGLQKAYMDRGGGQTRLLQLQASLRDAKAQLRHLEVLHSIWEKQQELLPMWAKVFDIIPICKRWRLQRLYLFFQQNFNDRSVQGLSQKQLDDLLQDKIRKAAQNLRFQSDILHQIENHLVQQQLACDRCLHWCNEQQIVADNYEEIAFIIEHKLWQDLALTAAMYWQNEFIMKPEYHNFLIAPPQQIDWLLVEHAQYISPMQAGELLTQSKKILAFGDYNVICNPRFALQIDYELTKYHSLATCDTEFEDLQFDGVLGSVGNMWNLITQGREADQFWEQTYKKPLHYAHVDVRSQTSFYNGSKVNYGVVDAVLAWLRTHDVKREEVVIYTCFSGQAQLLTKATGLPVYLLQNPCFIKSKISLFVPVYTAHDSGPYCFDRGNEMLEQLHDNTLEQLVVLGDMRIFKPELHSASGKFAKLLLQKLEVECV